MYCQHKQPVMHAGSRVQKTALSELMQLIQKYYVVLIMSKIIIYNVFILPTLKNHFTV